MIEHNWSRQTLIKYILLQLPELFLVFFIFYFLCQWLKFSIWYVWLAMGLLVVKDIAMFPFVWTAYESTEKEDRFSMIGQKGIAKEALSPSGFVLVGGEIWKAQIVEGYKQIKQGESILVVDRKGLTLIVKPGRIEQVDLSDFPDKFT